MAALWRTNASTMSHSSRTIVTPANRIAIASRPAVEGLEQRGRAGRIGLIHDLAGAALGRGQVEGADALLDPGQPARRHRQLADPEADQQPGEARIAGDLAADADRDAGAQRRLRGELDEA